MKSKKASFQRSGEYNDRLAHPKYEVLETLHDPDGLGVSITITRRIEEPRTLSFSIHKIFTDKRGEKHRSSYLNFRHIGPVFDLLEVLEAKMLEYAKDS